MNKILKLVLNVIIVYIIVLAIYYIAKFFNVPMYMYMPYLLWLIVLFIFYLLLGTNHENIYIKFVEKNRK